ncbi:Gfo/Idh/MocA family oxidoreductase [Fulvivirgaceae bacterium BMA12]|uniref:Gfo/Idh/MocA family oxidoreductase n=1 Tax=Agaribacillus aureus TaxID=3051825 RepID=A0ABT8L6T9_9BACT|nr:Gfo/Idh/MocA family oxidoreductase [Fulvivirgaceae bacterium BMA12]
MRRRTFIKNTGLAISALPLYSATFQNQTYKVALIGCGWWGMNILREAIAYGQCRVVGLCDVDQKSMVAAKEEVGRLNGNTPKIYGDYRELITREKPDIAIVATPDHWHALPAIMAIKNGAHVYIEKPIGHTIGEGQAVLKAARTYDRKVQVGTHRRLSSHNISAMEFLRSGKAGKIVQVKAFVNYQQGPGISAPDSDPPEGLDWNMWLGPAPERNYNPRIHPKGFRQYLDFANGTMADWGIHWFDQVLWWTEEKSPKHIYSYGDRYIKQDGSDAPDTQLAIFQFESFTLEWEHKLCTGNLNEAHNVGCYFYGTEGTLHLGWLDGWTFYPKGKSKSTLTTKPVLHDPDHQNIKECWADFIQAIAQDNLPVCDIETGHLASNISLLGMISYKLGRSIVWDGEREIVPDDPEANKLLSRQYRGAWEYPK